MVTIFGEDGCQKVKEFLEKDKLNHWTTASQDLSQTQFIEKNIHKLIKKCAMSLMCKLFQLVVDCLIN